MAEYAPEALPERQPALATFLPTGIGGLAVAATLIVMALAGVLVLGGYEPVLASLGRVAGDRFAKTITALGACLDPRSAMSLAGWLSQVLLAIAAAVAIVVRGMRRHRRDDYRGRYRAWGWLAGLLIGATCAAQFPLGRLVGLFFMEATGIEFGPQGFGWWVVVATSLLGVVSAWAVLPLHERLATSAWLSAALASWAASAACTASDCRRHISAYSPSRAISAARNWSSTCVVSMGATHGAAARPKGSSTVMRTQRAAGERPWRASLTRALIQSLTSDSSQPTARGPSGTGGGSRPSLMYS